jgi:hypothetical protein
MDTGRTAILRDVVSGTMEAINDYLAALEARGRIVVGVHTTPAADGEPWCTAHIDYTAGADPAAGGGTAPDSRP